MTYPVVRSDVDSLLRNICYRDWIDRTVAYYVLDINEGSMLALLPVEKATNISEGIRATFSQIKVVLLILLRKLPIMADCYVHSESFPFVALSNQKKDW